MLFWCMSPLLNVAFVSEAHIVRCPELVCAVSYVVLYCRCNLTVGTVCFSISTSEEVSIESLLRRHVLLSTFKEYVNMFDIITSDLYIVLF